MQSDTIILNFTLDVSETALKQWRALGYRIVFVVSLQDAMSVYAKLTLSADTVCIYKQIAYCMIGFIVKQYVFNVTLGTLRVPLPRALATGS